MSIINEINKFSAEARESVENVRQQIADTQQQITDLNDLPLAPDEAEAFALNWIDAQAQSVEFQKTVEALAEGSMPNIWTNMFLTGIESVSHEGEGFGPRTLRGQLAPLLCCLFGDAVKDKLLPLVRVHAEEAGGISTEDKAKQLKSLNAKLVKLEVKEEKLITEAEQAGIWIDRRSDCRPEIVLEYAA